LGGIAAAAALEKDTNSYRAHKGDQRIEQRSIALELAKHILINSALSLSLSLSTVGIQIIGLYLLVLPPLHHSPLHCNCASLVNFEDPLLPPSVSLMVSLSRARRCSLEVEHTSSKFSFCGFEGYFESFFMQIIIIIHPKKLSPNNYKAS